MRLLTTLALAVITCGAQAALTVDGYYDMQRKHGKDHGAIELQVRMYVDGMLDGLFMASRDIPEEKRSWCIPDDQPLTDDLAFEMFQRELKLRKQEYAEFSELGIDVPFSLVMVDALQRAFPCGNR